MTVHLANLVASIQMSSIAFGTFEIQTGTEGDYILKYRNM